MSDKHTRAGCRSCLKQFFLDTNLKKHAICSDALESHNLCTFSGLINFQKFVFYKTWSSNDSGRIKQGYIGILEISRAVCIHVIILINDSFVSITTPVIQNCELMHSTAQRRSIAGKCIANE